MSWKSLSLSWSRSTPRLSTAPRITSSIQLSRCCCGRTSTSCIGESSNSRSRGKMFPSPPCRNHKQEHDAENSQLEESRRVRLGGGHWYDPLFSGAFSRRQYLSPGHGSEVAVCIPSPEVLLHAVLLLDPVHWLLRCALGLVRFCA